MIACGSTIWSATGHMETQRWAGAGETQPVQQRAAWMNRNYLRMR